MQSAKDKVKSFIVKLGIYGSIYFLIFPVILIVSLFIAPYVQHRVITIGTLAGQTLAILLLSYICTSKKSDYYQASIKS